MESKMLVSYAEDIGDRLDFVVRVESKGDVLEGIFANHIRFLADDSSGTDWDKFQLTGMVRRRRRRTEDDGCRKGGATIEEEGNDNDEHEDDGSYSVKRKRMRSVVDDAPATNERIVGEKYGVQSGKYEGKVMIWANGYWKCEHGRKESVCRYCGGSQICEHGRLRSYCKECGGSQICEHRRQRSTCGSQICEHGRRRSQCKECQNY